jgi:hypothetical protein
MLAAGLKKRPKYISYGYYKPKFKKSFYTFHILPENTPKHINEVLRYYPHELGHAIHRHFRNYPDESIRKLTTNVENLFDVAPIAAKHRWEHYKPENHEEMRKRENFAELNTHFMRTHDKLKKAGIEDYNTRNKGFIQAMQKVSPMHGILADKYTKLIDEWHKHT